VKASELIAKLQEMIAEHGDRIVMVEGFNRDGGTGPEEADVINFDQSDDPCVNDWPDESGFVIRSRFM
jgi:hypothetical protein